MATPSTHFVSILSDRSTLYMIQVHSTRSKVRHYRIFAVVSGAIEDVTAQVCISISEPWDELRGTYRATAAYRSLDASTLAFRLKVSFGFEVACTIL